MTLKSITLLLASLALTPTLFAAEAPAQPTPKSALIAISKENHTLAIVDPTTLKVIAKMPVGPDPHEVVTSADGKMAYVSNMGSGHFHELDIIDLVAQKALPAFDTESLLGLHGLHFVGGKVWFTAQGSKLIGRFDPATNKVDWTMGTGQNWTHMIYVAKDEKQVYTTNVDSGNVSIIENTMVTPTVNPKDKKMPWAQPHLEWIQTLIPVGKHSEGFDVSPNGKELWTAGSQDGSISIIDIAAKKVVKTIEAKVFGANRLKFTLDGKHVLISSMSTGDLFIYDVESRKEVKKISVGVGASGIQMDRNGTRAFVACTASDHVAVIDLQKWEMTGQIDVGGKPDGLAWMVRE